MRLAHGGYSVGVIIIMDLTQAECWGNGSVLGAQCPSLVPVFLGEHSTVLPEEEKQSVWKQELCEPGAALLGGGGVCLFP